MVLSPIGRRPDIVGADIAEVVEQIRARDVDVQVGVVVADIHTAAHTMLHSVFERALRDRVVTFKPSSTQHPKVVKRRPRTLTPAEYDAILAGSRRMIG